MIVKQIVDEDSIDAWEGLDDEQRGMLKILARLRAQSTAQEEEFTARFGKTPCFDVTTLYDEETALPSSVTVVLQELGDW